MQWHRVSQYRSHGYLFNLIARSRLTWSASLNTVLTVISLIQKRNRRRRKILRLNTVLTVISLITITRDNENGTASLNTVLTVISLITLISNNISHLFNFSSSCNPLTIICLTSIFPIFRKFTHFSLQTKRKQPYLY